MTAARNGALPYHANRYNIQSAPSQNTSKPNTTGYR